MSDISQSLAFDEVDAVRRLGSSIQHYGAAFIAFMVLSFIIGLFLGFAIIGLASSSRSVSELLIQLADTMTPYLFILFTMSILLYGMFAVIYYRLSLFPADTKLLPERLNQVKKIFLGVIAIIVVRSVLGIVFVNLFLDDIRTLASHNPTVDDLEYFISNQEIIWTNLLDILISMGTLYLFYEMKNWFDLLGNRFHPKFSEASSQINTAVIGLGIEIFAGFLSLIPNSSIGGTISMVAGIFVAIGCIKAGLRLQKVSSTIDHTYTRRSQPSVYREPIANRQTTQIRSCPKCTISNDINANFCSNCGQNFEERLPRCPQCFAEWDGRPFCSGCGHEFPAKE